MITILHRYIVKTILLATLLMTVIFAGVLTLLSLLSELKSIGQGDYGLVQAMLYVLLRLPNQLYQISPMLILLGSVVGLSALANYRELTLMRTSGFSVRQIIHSVFMAAAVFVITICFIGEGFAPNLSYKAEVRKENAQNAGQAVITAAGVWFHVDNNFIHVQHVVNRSLLEDVTRYQFDSNRHLQAAYFAKSLSYEGDKWIMNNAVKTTFYGERTKSEVIPQAEWNIKFNTNLFNVGLVDPNEMTLPKLSKFAKYLQVNGLQSSEYLFEYWQRVFKPIAAILMIFLALPFVLGTLSAATTGRRLLTGILVGFSFFITNALLGQLCIVYQVPAAFAALLPLGIFAFIGFYLSRQLIRQ